VILVHDHARLSVTAAPARPTAAVLVLHGGSVESTMRVARLSPAALRMVPIAGVMARRLPSAAVYRLRFSVRGWNGDGAAVLRDARWAVDQLAVEHPGLPIVAVGHSLGARVAAQTARTAQEVVGAVGLAPWLVADDPVVGLQGVPLFVVQGTRDRTIPEHTTRAWLDRARAEGASVTSLIIERGGHPMLRYARRWHAFAVDGVRKVLATAEPGLRLEQVEATEPEPT
jgi:predicted esterase